MAGGGGGRAGGNSRPIEDLVRDANSETDQKAYGADVNRGLKDILKDFNDRDVSQHATRLDTLKKAIESEIEGTIDLVAGGSVKKHTYVDGISDVDSLALVNNADFKGKTPAELIKHFADKIQKRLPNTTVTPGDMAVTVRYSDGLEIQILPALKTATGYKVPGQRGNWSDVVRPNAFATKLSAINVKMGGNLIPVIKLFKGLLNENLPANSKLSGYHIESLAINAFRNYNGRKTYKDMLVHMTKFSVDAVKSPIGDSTGQTVHVDDYMGAANSAERRQCSAALNKLSTKLQAAERKLDSQAWKDLEK